MQSIRQRALLCIGFQTVYDRVDTNVLRHALLQCPVHNIFSSKVDFLCM